MIFLEAVAVVILAAMTTFLIEMAYRFAKHGHVATKNPRVTFVWCLTFAAITILMIVHVVGRILS